MVWQTKQLMCEGMKDRLLSIINTQAQQHFGTALEKPPQTVCALVDQISRLMQVIQFHLIWPLVSVPLSLAITLLFLDIQFYIVSSASESQSSVGKTL